MSIINRLEAILLLLSTILLPEWIGEGFFKKNPSRIFWLIIGTFLPIIGRVKREKNGVYYLFFTLTNLKNFQARNKHYYFLHYFILFRGEEEGPPVATKITLPVGTPGSPSVFILPRIANHPFLLGLTGTHTSLTSLHTSSSF